MLGKLESVTFYPQSKQIGDFLGAFKEAALSSSVQNTLSEFHLQALWSWNPDYSSFLPFTQLVGLDIYFTCYDGCPSRVDDNILINLSRAMPKSNSLKLGGNPCRQFTICVTAKGLVALAHHCPNLHMLRVHFQATSLSTLPESPGITPDAESASLCMDRTLTDLVVGEIPVLEELALMVTQNLLHIFPRIEDVHSTDDEGWEKVQDAITNLKRTVDRSTSSK